MENIGNTNNTEVETLPEYEAIRKIHSHILAHDMENNPDYAYVFDALVLAIDALENQAKQKEKKKKSCVLKFFCCK